MKHVTLVSATRPVAAQEEKLGLLLFGLLARKLTGGLKNIIST